MKKTSFADAIEQALAQAMAEDERVMILGEDVHLFRINLFSRFGKERVLSAPISESAFVGAGVTAAMGGLRPVIEVMLIDFIGVAMDAILNHASKVETFSGGAWNVPIVIRASCGGGYGDAGQHEQTLWGWLAHIPGLSVVVPSTPSDAGGLMLASIQHDGPVIFLEHKLLSDFWLDYMGIGGRKSVRFEIPGQGSRGFVSKKQTPIPLGTSVVRTEGKDMTLVSVGVGVHRCIEASRILREKGISAEVIDLRTVAPIDKQAVCDSVRKTGRLIVVDEDYEQFGLSGELAAVVLEAGIPTQYRRVCTKKTIPYSRELEYHMLPNCQRIVDLAESLI